MRLIYTFFLVVLEIRNYLLDRMYFMAHILHWFKNTNIPDNVLVKNNSFVKTMMYSFHL